MSAMSDEVTREPAAARPPYAFHDPTFVRWWLDSLYLLPAQQQLEAALALRGSVHSPEIRDVIDVFAGTLAAHIEYEVQGGAADGEAPGGEETDPPTPRGVLRRLWKAAPIPTAIGMAGISYMVLGGIWSVVRVLIAAFT